jgi:hypothetical protein
MATYWHCKASQGRPQPYGWYKGAIDQSVLDTDATLFPPLQAPDEIDIYTSLSDAVAWCNSHGGGIITSTTDGLNFTLVETVPGVGFGGDLQGRDAWRAKVGPWPQPGTWQGSDLNPGVKDE